MFASLNITFLSFLRRLTHSIFQFGLTFFFFLWAFGPDNTPHWASFQARYTARHPPSGGWLRTLISTVFSAPRNFTILRLWYPHLSAISCPSMTDYCSPTLEASGHGSSNSFSAVRPIPDAPVLLPALVPICKAAPHSYCSSLRSRTWCFPAPATRGTRQDMWSAWRSGWTASGPALGAASPSAPRHGNTKWHRVALFLIRCGQTWLKHKCKSSSFFSCL